MIPKNNYPGIKNWLLNSFQEFNKNNFNPYEDRIKNIQINKENGDYSLPFIDEEEWVKNSVKFHINNGIKEGKEEVEWYVKIHNLFIPCVLYGKCDSKCYIYQNNCKLKYDLEIS